MKQIIAVLVWTLLFISLGIYSENKIYDFTEKFTTSIELIQKDVEDDKLTDAEDAIRDWSKSWHKDKEIWYKIVDHQYFDDICLALKSNHVQDIKEILILMVDEDDNVIIQRKKE